MSRDASEITSELARNAEAVCRHYLPAGRREGSYWIVGDITNNPGRSLYVRLVGPAQGKGAAGKYTEHVAARVMLPGFDFPFVCCGLLPSAQHNVCARWGIS